jgi:pyrroline-5-carboxylate reductase
MVKTVFDAMGQSAVIEERQMTAATALCSCGIAFAMRYVRAATEGGVELGIYAHQAKDYVLQTLRGAVELLEATGNHPEAEIDRVTTPGGITIRGLNAMEAHGFTNAVIQGLKASK